MTQRFPLYIPSKGRAKHLITSSALTEMNVPHYIIVEPQEVDEYSAEIKARSINAAILPLDMAYKDQYETCDSLGLTKSTGPGPARNFAWQHSISQGAAWHWVMDDNISSFRRMHNRERIKVITPKFWNAMEDFVLRYKNVAMAGPNYSFTAFGATKLPPFIINTRIYSCNFIRNDTPFKWRGRYNEDTILSLDMLTAGWCTIQFNAFLQTKMGTQTITGGNTKEFYHAEGIKVEGQAYADGGTTAKSMMLKKEYPELTEVVYKFNRVHHQVSYSPFKKQKLIPIDGWVPPKKSNGYGMVKKTIKPASKGASAGQ